MLTPSFDHSHDYAIGYVARHTGRVQSLTVTMSRDYYKCPSNPSSPDSGTGSEIGPLDGGGTCSSPDPYCTCSGTSGCTCSGTAGEGYVYVYLYKGVPGGGTPTYLGGAVITPSVVPLGGSGAVTVTLPTGTLNANKGDSLYFQWLATGTTWRFNFWGSNDGTSPDPDLTEYTKSNYPVSSSWSGTRKEQPQTTVQMLGCF